VPHCKCPSGRREMEGKQEENKRLYRTMFAKKADEREMVYKFNRCPDQTYIHTTDIWICR